MRLLFLQFFCCTDLLPAFTEIIQVLKGVGQGLIHAGDVADWIWYLGGERNFALNPAVCRKYCISAYFRFRDDIMIASANDELVATYVKDISVLASRLGYVVKLESRDTTVPFLDIEITVTSRGTYTSRQCVKPAAVNNTPLDPRSGQADHDHGTWPLRRPSQGCRPWLEPLKGCYAYG